MKPFKGYDSHNEARSSALDLLHQIFDLHESNKKGDGWKLEEEILDEYDAVTLSDLSTATLIKVYNNIMDGKSLKKGADDDRRNEGNAY